MHQVRMLHNTAPQHPRNIPHQPCLQRQGMSAAMLPPSLASLASLQNNIALWRSIAAVRRTAQERRQHVTQAGSQV